MKAKKSKRRVNYKLLIILIFIIILISGLLAFLLNENKTNNSNSNQDKNTTNNKSLETPKKVNIIDVDSNSRNIAVMVNNIKTVWGYQSGLQDAYIVYEIIAEGGITRFMALYKDANTERIGTVRSARIYYLDYALENDAMYVHIGGSKEALSDIKTLKMNDFNSEVTFRDRSIGLRYEHTAFTSISKIMEVAKKRGVRTTTNKENLLNYSIDEIDLSNMDGAIKADNIFISYSGNKNTSYEYDSENKVYKRSQNDIAHVDYVTKKQYTAKNIITYQVKNSSYDSYGRQALDNIGNGEGYYITDGYAVPITWEKKSRDSQTVYRYKDGKEITVNDGNTFIQIQPKNRKLTIN